MRHRVHRTYMSWGVILLYALLASGCQTVPITGRQQLMLLSEAEEARMGISAYEQILQEAPLSEDYQSTAMVRRVGHRIAAVVARPDFAWAFEVIDKDDVNAFALPGGKVAVYTGILDYTQTESGLAVVIGHEVAHVLARHGGERVSQTLLAQMGLAAVQAGLRTNDPAIMRGIEAAYGIGVALPFSRHQESEADHIGLILMAKAGYEPREAISFWQRMTEGKHGKAPPEFLATHPSGETRIAQLRQWMEEAMRYYQPPSANRS